MPVHILLTKADKLKRGAASQALLAVRGEIAPWEGMVSAQLFSALRHDGHGELRQVLDAWLTDASVYAQEEEEGPG